MLKRIVILILTLAAVTGCATFGTTVKLSDANRPKLNTIYINDKIPVDGIHYFGPGVPPRIGDTSFTQEVAISRINQFVTENKIEIDEIVKQAMVNELTKSGKTITGDIKDALSVMHLTVLKYGFSIPNGFSSKLVPFIIMRVDVLDQSGTTIWSYQNFLDLMDNPVEAVPALEILNNAENMRIALTEGVNGFAKILVEEMDNPSQELNKFD